MTSALPTWFLIAQPTALLVLAGFAAFITYRQWRTADDRLRLDLFDKRMKVYEATRNVLIETITSGVKKEALLAFWNVLPQSEFLFDASVKKYLDSIADAEAVRRSSESRLKENRNEDREKIVAESDAAFQKLKKAYEAINNEFRPFMAFSHIQRKPQ